MRVKFCQVMQHVCIMWMVTSTCSLVGRMLHQGFKSNKKQHPVSVSSIHFVLGIKKRGFSPPAHSPSSPPVFVVWPVFKHRTNTSRTFCSTILSISWCVIVVTRLSIASGNSCAGGWWYGVDCWWVEGGGATGDVKSPNVGRCSR